MSAEKIWSAKLGDRGYGPELCVEARDDHPGEGVFFLQMGAEDLRGAEVLASLLNEREKYRAALERIGAPDSCAGTAALVAQEALKP